LCWAVGRAIAVLRLTSTKRIYSIFCAGVMLFIRGVRDVNPLFLNDFALIG
jgi:hypothetical protein